MLAVIDVEHTRKQPLECDAEFYSIRFPKRDAPFSSIRGSVGRSYPTVDAAIGQRPV